MGHFFSILGYEVAQAPDNFFYSDSYTMLYAEPRTLTGMLAIYQINDQLSASAGFHRGLDQFDDTDGHDSLGFIGDVRWTNWNERLSLAFAISATEQRPLQEIQGQRVPDFNLLAYSVVGTLRVTDRLTYVLQHDCIQAVARNVPFHGTVQAEGYGASHW